MTKKKNGIIQQYYDKEKIHLCKKYFIFNGKEEGEYFLYHYHENHNEQLYIICNYINNKKEGQYKSYYTNKKIACECNYINDKTVGEYTVYNPEGGIMIKRKC
jgi:antitoxin component YwqK of YwqJK toxin-antitoxin module